MSATLETIQELRRLVTQSADAKRIKVSTLLFDQVDGVVAHGYGRVICKQREDVNAHLLAAMGILAAMSRESDLFRCQTCEEHFVSHDATPVCVRSKTHKVVMVPEDTIYCGCCNRGADWLDEDGNCEDCRQYESLAAIDRQISLEAQRA